MGGDTGSSFRTRDVDEARREIGARYYANFMDVVETRRPFAARFDIVDLGPLVLGELICGADVRMRFGELGQYHVDAPLTGSIDWRQGGRGAGTMDPASGVVFDPAGDTALDRWGGDCRVLAVKIDADALRARLDALLGRPAGRRLAFAPRFDLTGGPGLGWLRLARRAFGETLADEGLARHPLIAAPLQEALLNGLLLAADHPYREELAHPGEPRRPAPVRRAMDAVRARPEHPHTTAELAALARVGVRRLQESFREYLGMTPMAYVRQVRLDRVRDELRTAEPDEVTVGEVAWRWGFTHPGRFAAQYRERYGETPSQTLRGTSAA
ncbi:AraC family transcriptional regulator [Streptomyces sp. HUAS MG47]|uniref:AraC family transcriptional regulator n=1 Tax=Streptomyces solicamelliae TaxID=3231716 RepID=UPI0038783423